MRVNCPKCGAFMTYDAYYNRWACNRPCCDGMVKVEAPQWDGKPAKKLDLSALTESKLYEVSDLGS